MDREMNFFKRTYQTRQTFKIPKEKLVTTIKSFEDNDTVKEFYFDKERNEGFIQGNKYYLTYEIHQTNEGLILEIYVTCKIPFFVPRTYATGFMEYVNQHI